MYRGITAAGLVAAVLAVAGCGGVKLVPVTGVVTQDGAPVDGANVIFMMEGGLKSYYGMTDASGAFELVSGGGKMGAEPGNYKVQVTKLSESGGGMSLENMTPDSADYMKYMQESAKKAKDAKKDVKGKQPVEVSSVYGTDKSPLRATVEATGENKFQFKLQGTGGGGPPADKDKKK